MIKTSGDFPNFELESDNTDANALFAEIAGAFPFLYPVPANDITIYTSLIGELGHATLRASYVGGTPTAGWVLPPNEAWAVGSRVAISSIGAA